MFSVLVHDRVLSMVNEHLRQRYLSMKCVFVKLELVLFNVRSQETVQSVSNEHPT